MDKQTFRNHFQMQIFFIIENSFTIFMVNEVHRFLII